MELDLQAIDTIGEQLLASFEHWQKVVIDNIPNIVVALIVLIGALLLDDRAQRAVERIVGLRPGQRELGRLLGRMARFGVLIFALLYILSIFKLNTLVTSFVASLGIVGLVVAFALQDITKNFAAGVLLLILRPFRLDDRIKVKEFEGTVQDITLRATTLRTADGDEVLVPNSDVYSNAIVNLTRYQLRRFHVALTVPASVPAEAARSALEAELRAQPGLEAEPAPQVLVTAIGADTLTLDAQFWLPSQGSDNARQLSAVIDRLQQQIVTLKQPEAEQPEQV
jgi:small conductance mechanosensitive channel